jgi:predicted acyltransferase
MDKYCRVLSIILGMGWNFIFPVNKILWTSSYVLFAGGISLLLFGLFYWIEETPAVLKIK